MIPGKNTGDVLIKVFLTIKPYPMKDQKYVGYSAFPELILWLLISLVTYFKKALVNYLLWAILFSCSWLRILGSVIAKSSMMSGNM